MNSERWKRILALCIVILNALYIIFFVVFLGLVIGKVVVFNIYINVFSIVVCAVNVVAISYVLTYLFLHRRR